MIQFDVNNEAQDSPVRVAAFRCQNDCYTKFCQGSISQDDAQNSAAEINESASKQAASLGVVTLAEGANVVLENEDGGGVLLSAGLDSIKASEILKRLEASAKANIGIEVTSLHLSTDPSVVNSPRANEIFFDLESHYGLTKEKFTSSVLGSRGSQDALAELLSGRLPKEKFSQALSGAVSRSEEEKKKILDESRVSNLLEEDSYVIEAPRAQKNKQAKSTESLRESLREKLEKRTNPEDPFSEGPWAIDSSAGKFSEETLQPSDEFYEQLGLLDDRVEELTLFDVVRRKYQEKHRIMRPPQGL
jgi:hypothetical protein